MKPSPIEPNQENPGKPHGIAGLLASMFLNSKLTPLFIVASLVVGLFAVLAIPREEDPQIQVPMLDVMTAMPGSSPAEVEQRVTNPIENLMHEISGVEYVYSISSPGRSLVIVRFKVGTPEQDALVKVYSKLYSNADRTPVGASPSLVKVHSIDDVPILALTLVGRELQRLSAAANCRGSAAHHSAGPGCFGDEVDWRSTARHASGVEHGEVVGLQHFARHSCGAAEGGECAHTGGRICRGQPGNSG